MNFVNIDLSNVITGTSVGDGPAYDSSIFLKMMNSKDMLCFFKGKRYNGIGVRIIDDDGINGYKLFEFLESSDFINNTLLSICGIIFEDGIHFYTVAK